MDKGSRFEQGDPWFDDGNLILQAENNIYFKVHRGMLARQSEVFKDMLAFPQPSIATESASAREEIVRMYDLPVDLSNLLKAIYDGMSFSYRDIEDFFYIASILRTATKYFITRIRREAIQALVRVWGDTLEKHDAMVNIALETGAGTNDLTFPYVHPVHVLNLARETHVRIIIPSAIYFLSVYPYFDILEGKHPKLAVESRHGVIRPSSSLTPEDVNNYTLMYQYRIEVILDYIRGFCGERRSQPNCTLRRTDELIENNEITRQNHDPCSYSFARLASRASRSWYTRTGPLRWMLQTVRYLDDRDILLCNCCREGFIRDVEGLRREIWNSLPRIINLPSWEELRADES